MLKRGDHLARQQVGPRAWTFLPESAPELPAETPQPRKRLADWLTDPAHPLTARVLVNRVWQLHFGTGIVATANDFGVNGAPPSHPDLLDFLANEFVARGWQRKPLHRLILLSSTYRMSSIADGGLRIADWKSANPQSAIRNPQSVDPRNRLLWQFPRRRLNAEEIRDAMLSVADRLNAKAGGPSVILPVESDLVKLLYALAQWTVTKDAREHERARVSAGEVESAAAACRGLRSPDAQTSCAGRDEHARPQRWSC